MKMHIIGLEGSSGVSAKSGKPYEIGQLHTVARLAPPMDAKGTAKGSMGTTYRVPLALIKSVEHLPLPFVAEVDVQDVMRFGKREQEIVAITPVELPKSPAPVKP